MTPDGEHSLGTIRAFAFVHIPKTAGTAFRVAATRRFGQDAVHLHYKPQNPQTSALIRASVLDDKPQAFADHFLNGEPQMLCGHFAARSYLDILGRKVHWCTVIRDPVERVLSDYAHILKKAADPEKRRRSLPLETFIERPNQINKQHDLLEGLTLDDFAWIGETENFAASVMVFNQRFGMNLPVPRVNIGNWDLLQGADQDKDLRAHIAKLNQRDIALVETLRQHPCVQQARQQAAQAASQATAGDASNPAHPGSDTHPDARSNH